VAVAGRLKWMRTRRVWVTGVAAVLALLIAGVAVLSWRPDGGGMSSGEVAVAPSSRDRAGGPGSGSVGSAPERSDAAGSGAVTDMAAAPPQAGDPAAQQVPGVPVGGVQRSLVRTAQITVGVAESGAATRQVRTVAAAVGGLVVEEQTSDSGSWLVLKVPAETLDRVIDDVAAIGRVTARNSQVVDSTEEVVDLDARVASQQASVARVRTLLAQATSIGNIIAIESELSRREADLDSLTGRLAALRGQVALSTLTVDLRTPSAPAVGDDERAAGFLDGLRTGWSGLLALGTAMAAVVGFLLPFLPVLAVLWGVAWLARRIVRSRRVAAPAVAAPGVGRSGPGSEGES
jgi:hypothetical protein